MGVKENYSEEQEEIQVPVQTEVAMDLVDPNELKEVNVNFEELNIGRDPEKSLYSAVIQSAVEDYLFFDARGKQNTATPEDFLSAYKYLFTTRSTEDGVDKKKCFDVQFDSSSYSSVIKRSVMLTLIRKQREKLINSDYEYMARKMNSRRREYQEANPDKKYRVVNYDKNYLSKILLDPDENSLARLYLGE